MTIPCPEQERSATRGRTWAALGLFGALAAGLMWPVVAHLSSRVPGTATWAFDEYTFLWNDWYLRHALLDLHASPLHTGLIWYPLGIDLVLYTFNFTNAALALPLQLVANLVLASNVTLLLATALSGFGAYLLALYVLGTAPPGRPGRGTSGLLRLAALLAGVIYAAGSNRAVYAALGHYNVVTSQWLPFYVLYFLKTLDAPWRSGARAMARPGQSAPARPSRIRPALLAGLFFALAAWTEMTFAIFLALLSLVILAARWRSLGPMRRRWVILGRVALAGGFALLLWSPMLVPTAREFLRSDYAAGYGAGGWGDSLSLSADLLGMVTPTDLNPLLAPGLNAAGPDAAGSSEGDRVTERDGGWQAELRAVVEGKGRFRDINTVFLGYLTLALALLGAGVPAARRWLGRWASAWAWGGLAFALLSLGPLLQVGGRYRFNLDNLLPEGVTVTLPFALLHYIPFVNANRAPNRFSVVLMLALAVMAAAGAAWVIGLVRGSGGVEALRQAQGSWRGRGFSTASPAAQRDLGTAGERGGKVIPLDFRSRGRPARRARVVETDEGTAGEGPGDGAAARPARRAAAAGIAGLLALGILGEHLAAPLPTTDARTPGIYEQIAAEPGDFSILQLPLGWRNSYETLGSEDTRLQYYQSAHGKPIIGGNISRAPAIKMDYFRRIPLFRALTDLELYKDIPADVDAAARAQAGALMTLYDVRYLIAFPPVPGRYPYQDTWQRVQEYALKVLPVDAAPFWEEGGVRAYRVRQPAVPSPFRVDLGTAGVEPYLGAGWDPNLAEQPYGASATWVDGVSADLYLPLSSPTTSELRIAVAPLTYPGAPGQTLSVAVNGVSVLDRQPLREGWQVLPMDVPEEATRRGPNLVHLELGWAASPRRAFPDPASRAVIGGTGLVSPVNLEAHGFEEAFINATGADGKTVDASAGRRGYNVAVIDPQTGQVLDRQGFDTSANSYEADRLAAYLQAVRPGRIVALATKGDATAHLTPAAISALRGLGSKVDGPAALAGKAHALIGVQGVTPGSAAEEVAAGSAFVRAAGDFRTLSAAVDWVQLGK